MSQILWLDDQVHELTEEVASLRAGGHIVDVVKSEQEAITTLTSASPPDLLIQDLLRPPSRSQVPGGLPRAGANRSELSGWKFYEEVLRPYFPEIPVVICSYEAHLTDNLRQADDFNLVLVPKASARRSMGSHVRDALASQRQVYSLHHSAPHVVAVDFKTVTAALVRHLSNHPAELHNVSWVTFETLVEALLKEMGYEVHHTPLTRDGGADIWAIQRTDLGEVLYAIDAKKYAPDALVGPEPVRAIYGVMDMAHASVGMIVTTAHFSPAALQLADQHRYRLSLRDFDGVVQWIRQVAASGGST